ncbi:hypothetical protein LSP04_11810 [Levilactobacillus spicheri]|uniref:Uncharacterized protein n=1 Tax=Levilactobacillus spicheri TaxID=216463 RepID=A0ABQ0WPS6_9LACO|nr:hypothetical protein LSP04_11810 [Levilactobacillus spicheri]
MSRPVMAVLIAGFSCKIRGLSRENVRGLFRVFGIPLIINRRERFYIRILDSLSVMPKKS